MINGEKVFNNDGSPVEKYRSFIEKSFFDAEKNNIVDKYTMYRVKETVKDTVKDGMSDVQKVKAIHDKLCSMVHKDLDDTSDRKNHTDVSVFLNESSVCEGYARAMNLLLHEAGIESCYVHNADHAWVIAKVGNEYFHIDPTWDDGLAKDDPIMYEWFMLSDSQVKKDDLHSEYEVYSPSSLHDFQNSKLPECRYSLGDVDRDGVVDGKDASAILTSYAKTSMGEESTVDAVLGDFNFDGTVNAIDASAVLTDYAKRSAEN
jgi:hypothetical protein